jgi:hypothetical protein
MLIYMTVCVCVRIHACARGHVYQIPAFMSIHGSLCCGAHPCHNSSMFFPSNPVPHVPLPSHCLPPGCTQGGEDDLDALLAKFKLEDAERNTVKVEEGVPPPSPRVYASFVPWVGGWMGWGVCCGCGPVLRNI